MSTIMEILEQAKDIKPLGERNGVKLVSFADQNAAVQAEMIEGNVDPGFARMNPDGTVAGTSYRYAAVAADALFENRFRLVEIEGERKYEVVVDYRACQEQSSGNIYKKTVMAYVIARHGKKLVCEKTVLVSDTVFVREFIQKLDLDAMSEILPLIVERNSEVTPVSLSI